MHMQPMYRMNPFIMREGGVDVGTDSLEKEVLPFCGNWLAA